MSLLHSHTEGTHWAYLYPLVVTNISLICGWTTGPQHASLFPVNFSRLSLLSKILKGLPRPPCFFIFDWMSLICNVAYWFPPWSLALPSLVVLRLINLLNFIRAYYFCSKSSSWGNLWLDWFLVQHFSFLGKPWVYNTPAWYEGPPLLIWVIHTYWTLQSLYWIY